MDSQLTLVDTRSPTSPRENIVLIFDRFDVLNTTLRIRGKNVPSYIVNTLSNITSIYAGDCLLATITRRMFRRDQITFPGLRPMGLGSWLRAPALSTFPLVFHAWGRRFEWRENVSGQLVLRESNYSGDIVAWFSKGRRWHGDRVMHAAYLTIKPEMSEMKDMIVLSCMLAEHKLWVISVLQAKTAVCMMIFL